jgi:hypothetical protein
MKKLIILCLVCAALCGCKDAMRAQWRAIGKRRNVTLYASNGVVIKHWISTGSLFNETQSDGWYFEDEATHLLVEVTGTIVIEVIP